MNAKFKSAPELYDHGSKLIALGEALQDNRTRIAEIAGLAFDAGLVLRFSIEPPVEGETTT